jgi:hypothetical protein
MTSTPGIGARNYPACRPPRTDPPVLFGAARPAEGACVRLYDFEVPRDGEVVVAQSIALTNLSAAWPRIAKLAQTFDRSGCRIRVTDEAGGIVILVGVATGRRLVEIGSAAQVETLHSPTS